MSSSDRSRPLASHPALPVPIDIRPIRTARRMRLRLDERRGILKLTCPARTSRRAALDWVGQQSAWVEAQLARVPAAEPFEPGALIPLEGREVRVVWAGKGPRTPSLAGDELRCGGPREGFARRVELFLKRRALDLLSLETAEIASAAGLRATAVSVGDADTRWGSCSSRGRIRYSWRLILAPPNARRFVVAHEVAHLRHLDHGREFSRLEAQLFGGSVAAARRSLSAVGPRLKRIGRSG